eukprot:Skav213456  [mRNA]  locus=scaffold837:745631:755654:+ [translate_table: standard]
MAKPLSSGMPSTGPAASAPTKYDSAPCSNVITVQRGDAVLGNLDEVSLLSIGLGDAQNQKLPCILSCIDSRCATPAGRGMPLVALADWFFCCSRLVQHRLLLILLLHQRGRRIWDRGVVENDLQLAILKLLIAKGVLHSSGNIGLRVGEIVVSLCESEVFGHAIDLIVVKSHLDQVSPPAMAKPLSSGMPSTGPAASLPTKYDSAP